MKRVNEILLKSTEKIIDEKLSNIYYDKTFPSVIYGKNSDGTYKIVREGQMYDVPCVLGYELKVAQNVWVTMPCGTKNFKDMYISGLRGKYDIISSGGETGSDITRADIVDALGYTPCSPADVDNKISTYFESITNEEIDALFKRS